MINLGLFTISLATLLFELSLVRTFSVIIFSNYAFMIISTALFGFGLSGVICSVSARIKQLIEKPHTNTILALLFSVSTFLSFVVINNTPLHLAEIHKPLQMFYLAIYYLALMIPFFFSGTVIVSVFSNYAKQISKLYFYDLFGAAIGCILIIPVFKYFGGPSVFLVTMFLGILAAIFFNNFANRKITFLLTFSILLTVFFIPYLKNTSLKVHDFKRSYKIDQDCKNIELSRWSALSKIDVAITPEYSWKRLWIDGGTNESALIEFDGIYGSHRVNLLNRLSISFAHILKPGSDVAIIGSSGGREVLTALNNNPKSIDAIEMDPSICELVSKNYSEYIGHIFNDKRTNLICDEGRSFIKRSTKKYDIIQQVNNFTPIAMASGAINVSESYLLTLDAFDDYWKHLKDDGYLVLNRHNTFKIAVLAQSFLKSRQLNPKDHIVVIEGEDKLNNGFYLKKSPFTENEISQFEILAKDRNLAVLYSPKLETKENWYVRLLKNEETNYFLNLKGLNLSIPSDNKPFFEHIEGIGKIDMIDPNIPNGLQWIHRTKKLNNTISVADLTFVTLIAEATILSLLFIFLPLYVKKKQGINFSEMKPFLIYFFSIGFAFIILEICLIQKFVLFLGVPIYSISTIIFSLLLLSSIGSYITGLKEKNTIEIKQTILSNSFILGFVIIFYAFFLGDILNIFLGLNFIARLFITFILIIPLGIFMGTFFPLGMKLVHNAHSDLIPWVWGLNAYATVIGSVLGVVIAIFFGFKAVFLTAVLTYILGAIMIYRKPESITN